MIHIGKPINGISLNGDEWLLNEDNSVMEFENKEQAKQFLRDNGYDLTDDELEDAFTFKDTTKKDYYKFDRQTGACTHIGLLTDEEAELQDDCENTQLEGYTPLTKTEEVKMQIIENYIDWFCHNEDERKVMKINARVYAHEDHVDEIGGNFPEVEGKNEDNC